jgi:hypothetical protein
MLQVDPSKRPDIFQVSQLIFSMNPAHRGLCPVKNLNNSEMPPALSSLNPPMTETEWRHYSASQAAINSTNAQSQRTIDSSTTTVNPRERPKAKTDQSNLINIIPKVAPIKLPLQQQQQQQQQLQPQQSKQDSFGFDDNFSLCDTNSLPIQQTKLQTTPIIKKPMIQCQSSIQPQNLLSIGTKKPHRRSASHSSTIFQPNNNTSNNGSQLIPNPMTIPQPNSFQQQLIPTPIQVNQQLTPQIPNLAPISALTNNRLFLPQHSRSASASPK